MILFDSALFCVSWNLRFCRRYAHAAGLVLKCRLDVDIAIRVKDECVMHGCGRYEGDYVDSMQTGYGLMTWADGRRYEGNWLGSKCTGFGILTHKDGRRYEGEYVNDKMQGRGVYTWANGAKYDGEYRDNKKNGHGLHTWPDGSMYEGEYLDGMQTGQGYMAWGDGRVYRGAWVQSKCTGYGVLTHADGRRYEGYYLKDKMHGHGIYTWPDGRKYNGEYKNNLKHGSGLWTWPDGLMLEGQWADNLPCRSIASHTSSLIASLEYIHRGAYCAGLWRLTIPRYLLLLVRVSYHVGYYGGPCVSPFPSTRPLSSDYNQAEVYYAGPSQLTRLPCANQSELSPRVSSRMRCASACSSSGPP